MWMSYSNFRYKKQGRFLKSSLVIGYGIILGGCGTGSLFLHSQKEMPLSDSIASW